MNSFFSNSPIINLHPQPPALLQVMTTFIGGGNIEHDNGHFSAEENLFFSIGKGHDFFFP